MAKDQPIKNPLALAVLALLRERPMHPYEMASVLRARRKEDSIKLRYGSLYTVIAGLERRGFIEPREVQRGGRRPERTVYHLTSTGAHELARWMRELLSTPIKEYPSFQAALSLMPVIPRQEAANCLTARLGFLRERLDVLNAQRIDGLKEGVPELMLIEDDYEAALLQAEYDFVQSFLKRLASGLVDGTALWDQIHIDGLGQNTRADLGSGMRS